MKYFYKCQQVRGHWTLIDEVSMIHERIMIALHVYRGLSLSFACVSVSEYSFSIRYSPVLSTGIRFYPLVFILYSPFFTFTHRPPLFLLTKLQTKHTHSPKSKSPILNLQPNKSSSAGT